MANPAVYRQHRATMNPVRFAVAGCYLRSGVEREQLILETEAVRSRDFVAAGELLIGDAAVQLPGTMLVGVGQGGGAGCVRQSQVPQLALAGRQPAANLVQRLRPSQVTEKHGHQLAPAGEAARMALGAVFDRGALELDARKQLQHLAENAGYSDDGGKR